LGVCDIPQYFFEKPVVGVIKLLHHWPPYGKSFQRYYTLIKRGNVVFREWKTRKESFAQRTRRALLGTPAFKLAWLYKNKRWFRTENTEGTERTQRKKAGLKTKNRVRTESREKDENVEDMPN
jgi:uncharacterized protein (DUF1697 family)